MPLKVVSGDGIFKNISGRLKYRFFLWDDPLGIIQLFPFSRFSLSKELQFCSILLIAL